MGLNPATLLSLITRLQDSIHHLEHMVEEERNLVSKLQEENRLLKNGVEDTGLGVE